MNVRVTIFTVKAELADTASLENRDKIKPVQSTVPYTRDMVIDQDPYTVVVIEIVKD